ncbi:MAG: hypothetical protein R3Y63_14145 [Eubacteriales bacterium]
MEKQTAQTWTIPGGLLQTLETYSCEMERLRAVADLLARSIRSASDNKDPTEIFEAISLAEMLAESIQHKENELEDVIRSCYRGDVKEVAV